VDVIISDPNHKDDLLDHARRLGLWVLDEGTYYHIEPATYSNRTV